MKKFLKFFFIFLFVIFITLYISQASGYYQYRELQKKVLTDEAIKAFEKDVSEGKEIDINNYLIDTKKDYSNNVSKAGLAISNGIETAVQGGVDGFFKLLEKLFGG